MRQIPGQLDWRRLAEQHRPSDPAEIAKEVRRLFGEGRLSERDIETALRLAPGAVRALLQIAA